MIERIKKWNFYILKNHPIIWMSGLHILIPILIPLLFIGFNLGTVFNLDYIGYLDDIRSYRQTEETIFIILLILCILSLVTLITWQFYRFKKEINYLSLVKYYFACVIIYFVMIVTFFSPVADIIHEKTAYFEDFKLNQEREISGTIYYDSIKEAEAKTFILAKGLKRFYDEDSCYFNEWKSNNDLVKFNFGSGVNIPSSECTIADKNFKDFFIRINTAIHYLNFDDPIGVQAINNLESLDRDSDGILNMYDWCEQESGLATNYGCSEKANDATIKDKLIEKIRSVRMNMQYDYNRNVFDKYLKSEKYIGDAIKLIVNEGDNLNESFSIFQASSYLSSIMSFDINNLEYDFEYKKTFIQEYYMGVRKLIAAKENYNMMYIPPTKGLEPYQELLSTALILLVIISIISSLILTARFKNEALLSTLAGIIPWGIFVYILKMLDLTNNNSENYSILMVIPSIFIGFYWIKNKYLKSITWKRALFLHITNLSAIFVLFVLYEYLEYEYRYNNNEEIQLALALSVLALLLNVFFLYQYHRHLHLPKKSN